MRYNIYENGGAVEGLVTISGMTVTGYIRLRHNPVENTEAASKQYVDSLLALLDSNSVKQGVFNKERLPTFTGGQVTSVAGNNVLAITPTGVAPNTYTKITVGVNGLVTSGSNLTPADIPSISFSKITTGKLTTLAGYGIVDGVSRVNGAITGNLTLSGAPIVATDVATKQYTDNKTLNNKTYQTGDLITGSYDTPPTGFLRCNGGEVSKTTYAALYGVIGDAFGGGGGSSDLSVGSGKPWRQQYAFNTEQSANITGWTTGTSLPEPLTSSQAIVTKNRVYLLGGVDAFFNFVSTVYTAPINADGTLGTWSAGTSLPEISCWSQAIVTKNRVYLLGGFSGSAVVSTVYTAPINEDGTLGAWSTGPSLPGILYGSQAIVTKNRVYLLGGYNGSAVVSTVYTAPINEDGTLGTWATGTSLPGTLLESQAIVTKNRVYLLGGFSGSAVVSTVYTAPINTDGTLGTWSTGTNLPGVLYHSQAIVTKNRVYLLGGYNGVYISTVYTAPINEDGTLGTWATGTSLPGTLSESHAIVTKNRVYLLGGQNVNNRTPVSTVYTAPFSGGLNDYSSYYDGTVSGDGGGTGFKLPDYTSTTDPVGKVFVKF